MASRCRSISKSASSLLHCAMRRPCSNRPLPANLLSPHPTSFSRVPRQMSSLQSMLPFYSAVSAARLTSRLGVDAAGVSRSLSQGTLCSSNPGV
ncbi:hypothetical protein Taro_040580 [Colocasia esculenta]|uniref:Uncharacterized protein n=1 Tax=Colocasia esculenta TaxID=4460 RepID=A0A843WJE6_COLES|nr:hypothetical protein [Colocasia esculenta]